MAEQEDEIWGEWWLPDSEEHLAGRLLFDHAEGGRLTLIGDFSELPLRAWSRPSIFGKSFDGQRLTLLEPFWLSRPPAISGLSLPATRTLVGSNTLLRGAHVRSADDLLIRRAIVRVRGLRALCFRPPVPLVGIHTAFVGPAENESRQQRVDVPGGSLTFAYQTYETRSRYGLVSEEDVEVVIEIDASASLEEFEESWLAPLQALVIFAGREPTVLESIVVVAQSTTEVHPAIRRGSPGIGWDEERVNVIMPLPGLTAEPRFDYQRPLVPLAALREEAPAFIGRWWALHRQLGSSATTTLISALGSRLFLDNRLLNEISFAESYHRILHNEPPLSDAEHEQYVDAMLGTIEDPAHRKHYRVRLKYAAAQGQRQRLKWLINRANDLFPDLPGLRSKLADQLVDTRNALTHLDPTGPDALRDEPLYRAIELLEVTIQANLLLDLEVDPDVAASLIRASYLNQTPFSAVPAS